MITDKFKGEVAVKALQDCAAPHGGWSLKQGETVKVSPELANYLVINRRAERVKTVNPVKKGE